MTDAEWVTFEAYVRARAKDLGLPHWEITVSRAPISDEANYAETTFVPGRHAVTITVRTAFRDMTADEQRSAVIHELLHCHTASMQHVVTDDIAEADVMTKREHAILVAAWSRQMELCIDGIAEAIAHRFPVIAWPKRSSGAKRQGRGNR